MKLTIPNFKQNPAAFMRSCGYAFDRNVGNAQNEQSFMRRLAGQDYPRFHAYTHTENSNFIINLHLDQKKPSYAGFGPAHGGEYDGELIKNELERIKMIL